MIVSERYETKRLRSIASLVSAGSVLDLGFAQSPNKYIDSPERIVGADLRSTNARSGYGEEVIANVLELDQALGARVFDTVICGELIEHLEDPYQALRRIRRVIAPGGQLLLSTPNPLGFPVIFAEMTRTRQFFYTKEHAHYFLPRWMVRILEHTGFEVEKIVGVGVWTPWFAIPGPVWASYQVIYQARPTL